MTFIVASANEEMMSHIRMKRGPECFHHNLELVRIAGVNFRAQRTSPLPF
jgi:hypothetical protein